MAVVKPPVDVQMRTVEETTSCDTHLRRLVYKDEAGVIRVGYPVDIDVESITYKIDNDGSKLDILSVAKRGTINLTAPQIMALWGTQIQIIPSGVITTIGAFLADRIDAAIDEAFS